MNRAESLVIEAARRFVATAYRHDEGPGYKTAEEAAVLKASLMALALAVRAYDRAEKGRLRDADLGDQCRCPDHRYE